MKRVLFFLILLIFICSCKKKAELPLISVTYMRDYGVFNKGTYWIYQNDSTFVLDSAYVQDDPQDFIIDLPEAHFENISTKIHSTNFNEIRVSRDDLLIDIFTYGKIALSFGFNRDYSNPKPHDNYKFISFDSTYIINGIVYHDVITSQNNDSINHLFFTYYWSPKVGLVKFVANTELGKESWSLVKYKIE